MPPQSGCYEHSYHLTLFKNFPFHNMENPALCILAVLEEDVQETRGAGIASPQITFGGQAAL